MPTPSVWGDLNLAGQNANALSEEEMLKRKKKLMAGGQAGDFARSVSPAVSSLYGSPNL